MCIIYKKPKQTFWNVTYFMVDSWRAAWRNMTLASTWTTSASVVNLGEGGGQRQTVTQLASSKSNSIWLMFGSPLLCFYSGFPLMFPFFSKLLDFFVFLLRFEVIVLGTWTRSSSVIVKSGRNMFPLPALLAFFPPTDATVCHSLWSEASHSLSGLLLSQHSPLPLFVASVPVLMVTRVLTGF